MTGIAKIADIAWHRPVTAIPPIVTSPASPLYAPQRWRPEWLIENLVYQGGVPMLPRSSVTGGGFIPERTFYATEPAIWSAYATPVSAVLGGGFLPSRPYGTAPLANNTAAPGVGF